MRAKQSQTKSKRKTTKQRKVTMKVTMAEHPGNPEHHLDLRQLPENQNLAPDPALDPPQGLVPDHKSQNQSLVQDRDQLLDLDQDHIQSLNLVQDPVRSRDPSPAHLPDLDRLLGRSRDLDQNQGRLNLLLDLHQNRLPGLLPGPNLDLKVGPKASHLLDPRADRHPGPDPGQNRHLDQSRDPGPRRVLGRALVLARIVSRISTGNCVFL